MKKRLISVLLAVMISLLPACGNNADGGSDSGKRNSEESADGSGSAGGSDGQTTTGGGGTATGQPQNRGGVTVTPTENASVTYTEYTSADGYVSMQIPAGWNAQTVNVDSIIYMISVSHPEDDNLQFVYLTTQLSYESQDAIDYITAYGGGSKFPLSPEATTSSFFANSGNFFGYSDFEEIANLGSNGYGGDVLQAKLTAQDGAALEGLFSATILDMGTNYVFGTNIMFDLDEGIAIMTAKDGEFTNWQPVLSQIFATLEFSDAFWSARRQAWAQITRTSSQIAQNTKQMSDSVMSSWESRNNSYDIQSQAYSDATLGRERIYDTETGEVYYAKNGWYDSYQGSRYQLVESGSSLYNQAVTGTISE